MYFMSRTRLPSTCANHSPKSISEQEEKILQSILSLEMRIVVNIVVVLLLCCAVVVLLLCCAIVVLLLCCAVVVVVML